MNNNFKNAYGLSDDEYYELGSAIDCGYCIYCSNDNRPTACDACRSCVYNEVNEG